MGSRRSSYRGFQASRPIFYVGQHQTDRETVLTDEQYENLLDTGFSFATAPITNRHFRDRVFALFKSHGPNIDSRELTATEKKNPSLPYPTVPALSDEDTSLFPGRCTSAAVACVSPWIDLYSADPLVANISRQVLNLEVAYANFCGVRSILIPGPRADTDGKQVAQYARAVQEALRSASRVSVVVDLPMYREPGLEEPVEALLGAAAASVSPPATTAKAQSQEIDLYSCWDTWHTIRTMCEYSSRLFVALRMPKRLAEIQLQNRWFAEPLHYLIFDKSIFQKNRSGYPSLSRYHQEMIFKYMRLKNAPWFILGNTGLTADELSSGSIRGSPKSPKSPSAEDATADYPTLTEAYSPAVSAAPTAASSPSSSRPKNGRDAYYSYLKYVEREQRPFSQLENSILTSFQDWLQPPLQPLADNLESATYEVFEGDPVKYDQYEKAIAAAMADWKRLNKPSSAIPRSGTGESAVGTPTIPELVVTVAGAGRGPLVTRVIRASKATGVPIQLWALEKNQNAFVYLLRMNKRVWEGKVHLVKTDMREWAGPVAEADGATIQKVDILVSELLGSFGDNELSPECIDGIQKHLARPHGISIPQSYTAHLSPISYPRVHADIASRSGSDNSVFETPWVVHLFAFDFLAQKVPGHPKIQQAWEFVHPVRLPFVEDWEAQHGVKKVQTGGSGAMTLSTGLNEHNTRHCHLTFVCRSRGVTHGLAGYFESVLYQPEGREEDDAEPIEISIHPDHIDHKSKDMVSWFPIFFPLKKPIYFPQDSEIEVSMWRQTDDTKVWYEWLVEVYVWVGPESRVRVAMSDLHSSFKVACLM